MNDGLFIAQDKSLTVSNSYLFCSYHVMFLLLEQFRLGIKYGKTSVFHFSKSYRLFNPSLLNLTSLDSPILYLKKMW